MKGKAPNRSGPNDATWVADDSFTPRATETVTLNARSLVEKQRIGSGGTGTVFRARDGRLAREVAKKKLSPRLAARLDASVRFIQEAELTAQLSHPNIVPVHELDCDENGRFYFSMRLVQGRNLAQLVRLQGKQADQPGLLRQHLEVFLRIGDAVCFAHDKGVVHADIKPENIMVGDFGEAYMMDWGNAHIIPRRGGAKVSYQSHRDPNLARGTPAFAAPEQAAGIGASLGTHTDVFGLGAVLYFLVTGRAPFWARSRKTRINLARNCDFPAPESLNGSAHVRPLLPVIKKAMAQDPKQRHRSVRELRQEVERLLRGGAHFRARVFARGEVIVKEGAKGDEAFIIESGACVVSKAGSKGDIVLRELLPGDVFGETAVLAKSARTATVRASKKTTVRVITRKNIEEQMGLDSWLSALVLALAERFRDVDAQLAAHLAGNGDISKKK